MADQRDQDRWKPNHESQSDGERRPWEGYRRQTRQAPDYGSAGGQYTSRVGPDQNPYTEDEGAYAGVRNRSYSGQGNYNQGVERDWEREGRGSAGGYGQVGGRRQQAQDEGGYSRGSRQGGERSYGQGGYGEERDWGRDRGDHDNPSDARQYAYGPGSQSYGQAVSGYQGDQAGGSGGSARHDPDYHHWRQEQVRKYDDDYRTWRESQMKQHDDDYAKWRKERSDKFGNDFADWKSAAASGKTDSAASSAAASRADDEKKH